MIKHEKSMNKLQFLPKTIVQLESRETISGEAVLCSFVLSSSKVLCSPGSCYPLLPSAVLLCCCALLLPSAAIPYPPLCC